MKRMLSYLVNVFMCINYYDKSFVKKVYKNTLTVRRVYPSTGTAQIK